MRPVIKWHPGNGCSNPTTQDVAWSQRRELRTWKSMKLREHIQDSSMWNALRKMDYHTVKTFVQEPHPNEFAKMLEELFSGIVTEPIKPDIFTEQIFGY